MCCKLLETNSDLHDASCLSLSRKTTFHNHYKKAPSHQISSPGHQLMGGGVACQQQNLTLSLGIQVSVSLIDTKWAVLRHVQMNSNIQQSHFFNTPSLHNNNLLGILLGTPIHCTDWYFLLYLGTERIANNRYYLPPISTNLHLNPLNTKTKQTNPHP